MSKHDDFDPSASIQSQGGKARAEKLNPEKRKGIASAAASARWKIPQATHGGVITIGQWQNIQCFNLDVDGEQKRMISQKSFMEIIGVQTSTPQAGAKRIGYIVNNPMMPRKKTEALVRAVENPVRFSTPQGLLVHGYDSILIVDYCKALMQARREKILADWAILHAEACEKVVISLAGVAIAALIDEATGYQEIRERRALEALLDRYLQREFSAWAKRFPDDFYKEMFRLRGWEWKGMREGRPGCVGKDTNDLVYARLEVGILKELEARNPYDAVKQRRKGYHHCLLTGDFGVPALAQHLHTLITIMRGFQPGKWQRFKEFVDVSLPKKGDSVQFLLELGDC